MFNVFNNWFSGFYLSKHLKTLTSHMLLIICMCCLFIDLCCREFTGYISRYKSFFSILPETLCEGEMGVEEHTCWSGDDVVKR